MRTGRPPTDDRKVKQALVDYMDGVAVIAICKRYSINRATLYNYIRKYAVPMREKHYARFGE